MSHAACSSLACVQAAERQETVASTPEARDRHLAVAKRHGANSKVLNEDGVTADEAVESVVDVKPGWEEGVVVVQVCGERELALRPTFGDAAWTLENADGDKGAVRGKLDASAG